VQIPPKGNTNTSLIRPHEHDSFPHHVHDHDSRTRSRHFSGHVHGSRSRFPNTNVLNPSTYSGQANERLFCLMIRSRSTSTNTAVLPTRPRRSLFFSLIFSPYPLNKLPLPETRPMDLASTTNCLSVGYLVILKSPISPDLGLLCVDDGRSNGFVINVAFIMMCNTQP
jgi:hypothetical protein